MELETRRLILRPWFDTDAESLYQYASHPDVGPVAGWPPHTSVENSLEVIRKILSAPETYAVVPKSTGMPVGSVGIMFAGDGSAPMNEQEAEIGYWIGRPFWGQGLIPEGVWALLERCFTVLERQGVWCGYYDGNEKSKRVQEKCGFVYHHTGEPAVCPMGDVRIEHFTYQSRGQYFAGLHQK